MVNLWPLNSSKANFLWWCHKHYIFRDYDVEKKSLFIGGKQVKNDVKENIKRGIIASELPDQQRRSGQVRQSLRQETTRNVTFRLSLKNNDKFGNISKVHGLEASALKNFTIGTESHQGKINCGAFSEPDFIPNCFLWKHMSRKQNFRIKRYFEAITMFLALFGPS